MSRTLPPLPLGEVLDIVDRRRRSRATSRAVIGSAAAVAGIGLAGWALTSGVGRTDAAPPAVPAAPSTAPSSIAPPTTAAAPPPFDPSILNTDYLTSLQNIAYGSATAAPASREAVVAEAEALAATWSLADYSNAKVIIGQGLQNGTPVDETDPQADDVLVQRFYDAGYTDADAAMLAQAWGWADIKTVKILGALISEAAS